MDNFHNMSVPPKSNIFIGTNINTEYILISYVILMKLLKSNPKSLEKDVENYINNHKDYVNKMPTSYMLALNEEKPILEYVHNNSTICKDIDVILTILSKTVDHLYIPNRKSNFNKEYLFRILYFRKEDLYDWKRYRK